MKEEKTVDLGDFRIEFSEGRLKVLSLHNKKSLAVIPSSGNCIIVVPVDKGWSQFKTESFQPVLL